jgi:hypothetical protein
MNGGAPVLVPMRPHPQAVVGRCFCNVNELVEQAGGSMQLGWCFVNHHNHPGCQALAAGLHAVWRSPAGELLDITPPVLGQPVEGNSVYFLVDDSAEKARGYRLWICPPCRFKALTHAAIPPVVRAQQREWAKFQRALREAQS